MDERLLLVKSLLMEGKVIEAHRIASSIEDPYWRSYALRWVVEGYAKDPEKAIEVADSIEVPSIRDEALHFLSYLFSKNGNFKAAIEVAMKVKNQFIRKRALRTVSNYLAKAIISRGPVGLRLSDLNLSEDDLNALKPLPYGLVYKDGKLMPGSKVLPLKGEMRNGIIERFDKRVEGRTPPKPQFEEEKAVNQYVVDTVRRLIFEGEFEEAERIARGLPEPLRSFLLEDIGIKVLEAGDVNRAEVIFNTLSVANTLGSLLAKHHLDEPEEVLRYLSKVYDPSTRLAVVYETILRHGVDTNFLRDALLWATDEWKRGRILKFLAFEMLNEAKSTGNEKLRLLSKKLFELGAEVERTGELQQ